jgi:hypothetical protein
MFSLLILGLAVKGKKSRGDWLGVMRSCAFFVL